MTPRSRRLARLLGIRTVELRATARRLGIVGDRAATLASVTRQIDALRLGASVPAGVTEGYSVKAAAATSAALAASGDRNALHAADADRRRAALTIEVRQQTAAVDAISDAIARVPDVAADAEQPAMPRRPRR